MLDRDGTIIVEKFYHITEVAQVELLPNAVQGLRSLKEMRLGLLVITNQSAVGRKLLDKTILDQIHRRMIALLSAGGVFIDGVYVCPHTPEDRCACRKPETGLAVQAAKDHEFELKDSFVVGDNVSDIRLGKNIGATTILVRTGYGKKVEASGSVSPDAVADDLVGAAGIIGDRISQSF